MESSRSGLRRHCARAHRSAIIRLHAKALRASRGQRVGVAAWLHLADPLVSHLLHPRSPRQSGQEAEPEWVPQAVDSGVLRVSQPGG